MTNVLGNLRASSLVERVNRLTTRERLLIAGAAFIALTLAPLKVYDWDQAAIADYASARSDLDAANQLAARGHTSGVERQIAEELDSIHRWAWSAASLPVAQVVIQQQIITAAEHAGLPTADVKTSDAVQVAGPVTFISMDISAPFTWQSTQKLLQEIAGLGKGFYVQSMSIENDNVAVMKLSLRIPVEIGAAKAERGFATSSAPAGRSR